MYLITCGCSVLKMASEYALDYMVGILSACDYSTLLLAL